MNIRLPQKISNFFTNPTWENAAYTAVAGSVIWDLSKGKSFSNIAKSLLKGAAALGAVTSSQNIYRYGPNNANVPLFLVSVFAHRFFEFMSSPAIPPKTAMRAENINQVQELLQSIVAPIPPVLPALRTGNLSEVQNLLKTMTPKQVKQVFTKEYEGKMPLRHAFDADEFEKIAAVLAAAPEYEKRLIKTLLVNDFEINFSLLEVFTPNKMMGLVNVLSKDQALLLVKEIWKHLIDGALNQLSLEHIFLSVMNNLITFPLMMQSIREKYPTIGESFVPVILAKISKEINSVKRKFLLDNLASCFPDDLGYELRKASRSMQIENFSLLYPLTCKNLVQTLRQTREPNPQFQQTLLSHMQEHRFDLPALGKALNQLEPLQLALTAIDPSYQAMFIHVLPHLDHKRRRAIVPQLPQADLCVHLSTLELAQQEQILKHMTPGQLQTFFRQNLIVSKMYYPGWKETKKDFEKTLREIASLEGPERNKRIRELKRQMNNYSIKEFSKFDKAAKKAWELYLSLCHDDSKIFNHIYTTLEKYMGVPQAVLKYLEMNEPIQGSIQKEYLALAKQIEALEICIDEETRRAITDDITGDLMSDPVIVPGTEFRIDRSTLDSLEKKTEDGITLYRNPFSDKGTREELVWQPAEAYVSDEGLRAKIDEVFQK